MNTISRVDDDDGRVPDIQFEAIMSLDDVTAFIRDGLNDRILALKQSLLLAAMDRAQMVSAIRCLDGDAKTNLVESTIDFATWVKDMAAIAEDVSVRSLVAIADVAGMLKPIAASVSPKAPA